MYDEAYLKLPGYEDEDTSDTLTLRGLMSDGSALNSFMTLDQDSRSLYTFTENVYDTYEDYEIIL